jgi:hypothetical protein
LPLLPKCRYHKKNFYFYFVLTPSSSKWYITDSIFSSLEQLLEKWNDGTILFLMAFLAKSLFETKFSEDNKLEKSKIESKVNDVVQNLDKSNDDSVG